MFQSTSRLLHVVIAVGSVLLMLDGRGPLHAQADTVSTRPFFTWRDAAILEAFAIATVAIAPLDTRIAERLQNPNIQDNERMRQTAEFVEAVADPGSFLIGAGLYAYGRIRKNRRAADLGLHGTEALFIGAQFGNLLKGIIGRARPYRDITRPHDYKAFRGFSGGSDYRAFPSGHAIAAFAAASVVTSETKRWWPKSVWFIAPTMYGGAAAVGWSRMYNNRHWASDVITGAAIGTFTGLKVVHFHHTKPGNAIDRILLGASVVPGADGSTVARVHFASPF
jgi:membrane-associated phospholipid phosphatase